MIRRSEQMVTCGGAWSLVGEHNQPGESYEDAALRGVKEELGVDLGASDLRHGSSSSDGESRIWRLDPHPTLLNITVGRRCKVGP